MKRLVALVVAMASLVPIAVVVFRLSDGTFPNDLAGSILYISLGILLMAFAAWIIFH